MWEYVDPDRDFRSEDGKAFQLPRDAQGPTYFRYTRPDEGEGALGLALFLDYGMTILGRQLPFARLVVLTENGPALLSMGVPELNQFAGNLLDEVDRRRKLDVTIAPETPSADLVPHRLPMTVPIEQLSRLVGAMLDAADSLEIYSRTRVMRSRNPDT